jgi:DNA-binding transcriptional regulator WhiA
MRREVRATANRLANFDDANLRRSARAAVAAGARVERALEILGSDAPEHLVMAGRLRVANRQASLEELGQLADPPLTKDAIAGRIRRLLAMADRRAADHGGVPDGRHAPVAAGEDGPAERRVSGRRRRSAARRPRCRVPPR